MNPNHIVTKGRVVLRWKKRELSIFVSLTSHFMVSESWIRLDRHQRVGGYFASDTSVV